MTDLNAPQAGQRDGPAPLGSADLRVPVSGALEDPDTGGAQVSDESHAGAHRVRRPHRAVKASALEAVVFDVGNVILAWDPQGAVAGRVSTRAWEEFVRDGDFNGLNARLDAGRPFEQVLSDLVSAHPERPDWGDILRTYHAHHRDSLPGLIPGVDRLIEDLAAAGVPLYALTNFAADLFEGARPLMPALTRFDGVVISGRERLVKPDPAIYRLLLDRFGLKAGHTLFIDDSAANVAGAQAVGMQTHRFTGAGRLRADLVERGVLPSPLD